MIETYPLERQYALDYVLDVYHCRCGFWHIGHSRTVRPDHLVLATSRRMEAFTDQVLEVIG